MMFRLTHDLPKKYWVAISGGIDSAAVFHWLYKPSRQDSLLGIINIHHGTEYADQIDWLIDSFYKRRLDVNVLKFKIHGNPPEGESKENWWRKQRYEFFNQVPGDAEIILAHNMDDCLEEMVMSSFVRGYQSTIPYRHGRCVRPFRLWKKQDIRSYVARYGFIPFIDDPTNDDIKYKRNFIRHKIVPEILTLNPGVYNIVERLVKKQDETTLE